MLQICHCWVYFSLSNGPLASRYACDYARSAPWRWYCDSCVWGCGVYLRSPFLSIDNLSYSIKAWIEAIYFVLADLCYHTVHFGMVVTTAAIEK